jgi:hypothetical protein
MVHHRRSYRHRRRSDGGNPDEDALHKITAPASGRLTIVAATMDAISMISASGADYALSPLLKS